MLTVVRLITSEPGAVRANFSEAKALFFRLSDSVAVTALAALTGGGV
jgi:hypothetical protein